MAAMSSSSLVASLMVESNFYSHSKSIQVNPKPPPLNLGLRHRTRQRMRSLVVSNCSGPPPMVFERFQGVIDELFQHRIIRLGGPLEDNVANVIVSQLLYLDSLDPTKDIVIYINSPGGSVTAGMAIYDTMKHIRAPVSTVCVGLAASMSGFLLGTATKGKRFSLPNARIMIHQPMAETEGSQSDMDIQVFELMHHRAVLSGYLAYHTGQPLDKILKDTDRDFFMSAQEAKDYGLIDHIITNPLKALQNQPVLN